MTAKRCVWCHRPEHPLEMCNRDDLPDFVTPEYTDESARIKAENETVDSGMVIDLVTSEGEVRRTGLWCDACALPSGIEFEWSMRVAGTQTMAGVGVAAVCTDCGESVALSEDLHPPSGEVSDGSA